MEPLIGSLQAALAVAMATTFDDNIYLTGFFSETNRDFRPIHVVVGEVLGFTVLIGTSLLASRLLAATVPLSLVGWLGLMPILLGMASLIDLLKPPPPRQPSSSFASASVSATAAFPASAASATAATATASASASRPGVAAFAPPTASAFATAAARPPHPAGFGSSRPSLASVLRHRRTYMVSAITISNGGNNLAIYIPLLGTSSAVAAGLTVLVCYAAVACWLLLSFRLTRLPGVAVTLSRYGRRLFPFVLMWLGFRILHDSGVMAGPPPLG